MSRYLGIDYGTKRIGLALSDPTRTLASPLPCLQAQPFTKFIKDLKKLVAEQEVSLILVGMPRNMDGSYGPAAQAAQEFVHHLKAALVVPIQTIDERLSTVEASRKLQEAGNDTRKQRGKIDSASAQVLLQSHLDSLNPLF
jgi:putative Holliday junction resolvase